MESRWMSTARRLLVAVPLVWFLSSCSPAQPPSFQSPDSPPRRGPRPAQSTPQAAQTGGGETGNVAGMNELWNLARPLNSLDDLNSCAAGLPPIGSYSLELQPGDRVGPIGGRLFVLVRGNGTTKYRVTVKWTKHVAGDGPDGFVQEGMVYHMDTAGGRYEWESHGIKYIAMTNNADGGVTASFARRCPSDTDVTSV